MFGKEIVAGQQEGVVLEGPGDVIHAHVVCFLASYTEGKVACFGQGIRLPHALREAMGSARINI